MAGLLCQNMSGLRLDSRVRPATAGLGSCSAFRGQVLFATRQSQVGQGSIRRTLQVEAKQNSLRRQRTAEKARQYNKDRKTAVATRVKKVLTALTALREPLPSSEDDFKPVEKLMSEAYQEIDKAVVKGVIHRNTGARRKSRIAVAKRKLLVDAGLFVPVFVQES